MDGTSRTHVVVTAALAWYDEPLDLLEGCVLSLEGLVDRLVAVDGSYVRLTAESHASPPAQAHLIRSCCATIGVECDIHIPEGRWAGQLAKRDFLMKRATQESDWVLVVDADYVLRGDRGAARREVEAVPLDVDVIDVRMFTPVNPDVPTFEAGATDWHQEMAGAWRTFPLMPRALPDFRVIRHHWWYAARSGGEMVWIWGEDDSWRPTRSRHKMEADLWVEHRCLFRDQERVLRNRFFCEDRTMVVATTGQEDDPHMVAQGLSVQPNAAQ